MGAVGNRALCGFPSSCGRGLCVHRSAGVHSPPWAVPARVRSSVKWNTNSGEVERSSERSDVERSVPPSRFATGT